MDFFTEVAHEIRTPLTLINGPLEIINETKISDPRLRKHVDTIGQNTRRLLSLASQLLDFRKVGTDHLKPVFENVNINKLLTATLERFEPTFAHNGKTLTISHTDENITANIDREAITKVLSNLFNNALKYSAHATSISMLKEDDKLRLTVLSDGTRIPQDNAEHIFEPFFTTKKTGEGTGLGLAIVHDTVKLHGGSISVGPNKPRGSVFSVSFPRPSFEETGI